MLTEQQEEVLGLQYDILGHLGVYGTTEIRVRNDSGGMDSYFSESKEEFVGMAIHLLNRTVYVGLNPRGSHSGMATDITYLTCLCIDIDPVRPKDTASTPEQHKSALDMGGRISTEIGGYVVSSGSGAHIYFPIVPIKVINHEVLTQSVKKWMDAIRSKYATATLKIDPIHDLPRVIRLWGSFNAKSQRVCLPVGEINGFKRYDYKFSQEPESKPDAVVSKGPTEDRFQRLLLHNKRLGDIVNGRISYPSPSEADFAFILELGKAHFSIDEIESLNGHNSGGNKPFKKGDVKRIITEKLEKGESTSLVQHHERYRLGLHSRKMGILTGIPKLDEMTSGLRPGKLYIYAARPGEGKTTFAVQIADFIASKYGTVTIHPTEIGAEPIFDKIVSRRSGVNLKKFQNGTFSEADKSAIEPIVAKLRQLPITVVENFTVTPDIVAGDIKRFAPVVEILDFFQCMSWQDPGSAHEKYKAVKTLKQIAGDLNVPIILMSQLARGLDKPTLRSLSDTKGLEEYGDVISFIETTSRLTYPREVVLDVLKSKYSATGQIKLKFFCSTCEFRENDNEIEPRLLTT